MKYLIFIILLLFSINLFASEYECPQLPIEGFLGDKVTDEWSIAFKYDENNFENLSKYFQKLLGNKYRFESWFNLGVYGSPDSKELLLECCSLAGKKNTICVRKKVEANDCVAAEKMEERKFVCNNG